MIIGSPSMVINIEKVLTKEEVNFNSIFSTSIESNSYQFTSTILLPQINNGYVGKSSDYISKRNRSDYNSSNEIISDDKDGDNSLLCQAEKKLRYSDEWSESQFSSSSSSFGGQEHGRNVNDNSHNSCHDTSRGKSDLNSFYCSSDSNDENNEMKISPLKRNNANLSPYAKNSSGIDDRINQFISPKSSTPCNNNLSQKRVDDYFSTPKSEFKNKSTKELHDRPQKNLSKSASTRDDIQDKISINDCAEPMSIDDTCECCFREVIDTVISKRCCDCTKIGCIVCLKDCESCSETFCLRCCAANYSCSYERILCFDCDYSGR